MLGTTWARQTLCSSVSLTSSSRVRLTHVTGGDVWHRACLSSSSGAFVAAQSSRDVAVELRNSEERGKIEAKSNGEKARGKRSKNTSEFKPPPLPILPAKLLDLDRYRSSRYLAGKEEGSTDGAQESENGSKGKSRNRHRRPRNTEPPVLPVPPKQTLNFSEFARGRARPTTSEYSDRTLKKTLQQLERYASPKGKDWSPTQLTTPLASLPEPAELHTPKRSTVPLSDDVSGLDTVTKVPEGGECKEGVPLSHEPMELANPLELRYEFIETIKNYLSTLYAKGYLTSPQFSPASLAHMHRSSKFMVLMSAYSELLSKRLVKEEGSYELWGSYYRSVQGSKKDVSVWHKKATHQTKTSTPEGEKEIRSSEKPIEDAPKTEPAMEN